jgi:enoyl-CoA hydratase
MTMSNILLEYQNQQKIALIYLNRPDVHHAIDDHTMKELEVTVDQVYAKESVRVIILTATGTETFCAGGDLHYFAGLKTGAQAAKMSNHMQKILDRLWSGDRVVIVAINGQALGGGCEIVTACHFRIAAENARFSFRQAANGIITGWGGGGRLFALLGRSRALRVLLLAEAMDAKQAEDLGLVDRVVANQYLLREALALAEKICEVPAGAVKAFLQLYRKYDRTVWQEVNQLETQLFSELWVEEDFQRWLREFLESE